MTSNVKFFPLKFAQTEEQLKHLDELQRGIANHMFNIENSKLSEYEKAVKKENAHKLVRSYIREIKDF